MPIPEGNDTRRHARSGGVVFAVMLATLLTSSLLWPMRAGAIGQNDRTYIDNCRTPHTTQLQIVERFRLAQDGKSMEVNVRVEDPGAFTMPFDHGVRVETVL